MRCDMFGRTSHVTSHSIMDRLSLKLIENNEPKQNCTSFLGLFSVVG